MSIDDFHSIRFFYTCNTIHKNIDRLITNFISCKILHNLYIYTMKIYKDNKNQVAQADY